MVRDGLLVSEGVGRGMRYLLPWQEKQAQVFFGDEPTSLTPQLSAEPPQLSALTPELSALTPELRPSVSVEGIHVITALQDLDAAEVEKLKDLAQPVSSRERADPLLVQQTVLALCTERYVSLRVLAELLHRRDRDGADLRRRILNPLVAQGALKRAYPRPNDPRQAYIAVPQ